MPIGPFAPSELSVPPHKRCRGHDERRPALPRQHHAHRRDEQLVPAMQLGAFDLPPEHGELVAQDEQLGFGVRGDPTQPENASDDRVEKRVKHGGGMLRECWSAGRIEFPCPTAWAKSLRSLSAFLFSVIPFPHLILRRMTSSPYSRASIPALDPGPMRSLGVGNRD